MSKNVKWYFKNEKRIMKKLGFTPTQGSGSGWISKEDGENDYFLAQLKSTSANSYSIKRDDLDKLEYHSNVVHKIPVFVVQFIDDGKIYLTFPIEYMDECIKYWNDNKSSSNVISESLDDIIELQQEDIEEDNNRKQIKSGNKKKYNKLISKEKEREKEKWVQEWNGRKKVFRQQRKKI